MGAKRKGGTGGRRVMAVATRVFVQGFSFTRSFTHPYLVRKHGPVCVLRDAPRKRAEDNRREEWVACGIAPATVERIVRRHAGRRFCISAIHPDGEWTAARDAYKALGYRLLVTEPVMVHDLRSVPRVASPARINRVLDAAEAAALAKLALRRQLLPEHLREDGPFRVYVAKVGGRIAGWVRSQACAGGNWCSNMWVQREFRRRGIGRALLARMLRDDRALGARRGVLTASHAGAKLYETVGYRRVATLLLLQPK